MREIVSMHHRGKCQDCKDADEISLGMWRRISTCALPSDDLRSIQHTHMSPQTERSEVPRLVEGVISQHPEAVTGFGLDAGGLR